MNSEEDRNCYTFPTRRCCEISEIKQFKTPNKTSGFPANEKIAEPSEKCTSLSNYANTFLDLKGENLEFTSKTLPFSQKAIKLQQSTNGSNASASELSTIPIKICKLNLDFSKINVSTKQLNSSLSSQHVPDNVINSRNVNNIVINNSSDDDDDFDYSDWHIDLKADKNKHSLSLKDAPYLIHYTQNKNCELDISELASENLSCESKDISPFGSVLCKVWKPIHTRTHTKIAHFRGNIKPFQFDKPSPYNRTQFFKTKHKP